MTFVLLFALLQNPAALNPPPREHLAFQVHASGDQIYTCRSGAWTFRVPEAKLFDTGGNEVGKHFAGPTWESTDGSQVKGDLVASEPSPDPDAIPWLRLHTKAGKAPKDGCDAAHEGTETRSPYQADYLFYAPHDSSCRGELEFAVFIRS